MVCQYHLLYSITKMIQAALRNQSNGTMVPSVQCCYDIGIRAHHFSLICLQVGLASPTTAAPKPATISTPTPVPPPPDPPPTRDAYAAHLSALLLVPQQPL